MKLPQSNKGRIGTLQIETCQQGVSLLQVKNLQDTEMQNDAAYTLASQLLAAQLNLAVGSEYCLASDQAVSAAQLLLLELNFDGTSSYLGPPLANANVENAKKMMDQLVNYNTGALCGPWSTMVRRLIDSVVQLSQNP